MSHSPSRRKGARATRWAVLALALATILAPTALGARRAAITPSSIAGAKLGLSSLKYRALLGSPVLYERAAGGDLTEPGFQQPSDYSRLLFTKRKLAVFFQLPQVSKAIQITTWNKAYRTAQGVGPCSTVAALRAAYGTRLKLDPGNSNAYIVGRSLIFVVNAARTNVKAVTLYDGSGPDWSKPGGPLYYASFVGDADVPACR